MTVPFNQGGQGTYLFGEVGGTPASFDSSIMTVTIRRTVTQVSVPATYGNPVVEPSAGDPSYEMTIEWLGDPSDAASFHNLLEDSSTDDFFVEFDILFQDGSASSTNKRRTGEIFVGNLETGSKVNTVWQQTQTFPIRNYALSDS